MANNDNEIIKSILKDVADTEASEMERLHAESVRERKKMLKEAGKTEKEINEQLEKNRKELRRANALEIYRDELEQIKKQIAAAASEEQKKELEKQAQKTAYAIKEEERRLNNEKKIAELKEKAANALYDAGSKMYDDINKSVKTYVDYFSEIQTRLLGSGKTYSSVTDLIQKTFTGSPFFALSDAMNQVKTFVQQGIAYNVELRATLQTVSEKIATTFNALDSTLLRLIRIQGDSTQARLGIESRLTELLNSQFGDTSYLTSNINESVSAALLETEARLGKTAGTEFEYEAQKWLGSLYSVGASQNLITSLAQGLGYLGSGDVSSLNSNASLTNLLALASAQGGGKSLGDLITSGAQASDISALMTGLYNLVSEVSKTDNIVALKEYANVFGLSISDLKSILNLTTDDIKNLTAEMMTYEDSIQRVNDQLKASVLFGRTSVAEMVENLYSNVVDSVAAGISKHGAAYIGWKMAGIAAELTQGLTIEAAPLGMGASTDVSKIVKASATQYAMLGNLVNLAMGLTNLAGVNLNRLEGAEKVSRGSLTSLSPGTTRSYAAYEGNASGDTILKQSSLDSEKAATKVTDKDFDEQKKSAENMSKSMQSIEDNVSIIVKLLDSGGIVIRGRAGETTTSFASMLTGVGGFQG